jgi:hypothetical protein
MVRDKRGSMRLRAAGQGFTFVLPGRESSRRE